MVVQQAPPDDWDSGNLGTSQLLKLDGLKFVVFIDFGAISKSPKGCRFRKWPEGWIWSITTWSSQWDSLLTECAGHPIVRPPLRLFTAI